MEKIERDGRLFTPSYAEDGTIIKTAEENYNDWAAGISFAGVQPPDPRDERIAALEAQLAAYEAAYAEGVNEA